jgi:predicted O-methyltransferase YrrM
MTTSQMPILDTRVSSLLERLHRDATRQERWLPLRFLDQLPRLLRRGGLDWAALGNRLDDAFICLDRAQGEFCYTLLRALGARHVVEFGTSFGVSTIYLAAAVRDNGGGRVIGTELVPAKAERARAHLAQAGLADFVDIRVGDATKTLRDLDGPVDFLLNDGFPPAALPVLQLLAPRLRPGAVVLADNVGAFPADHRDYLAWVRAPANGFVSCALDLNEGSEMSVRC